MPIIICDSHFGLEGQNLNELDRRLLDTVNSEIFVRILFSRKVKKTDLQHLKIVT